MGNTAATNISRSNEDSNYYRYRPRPDTARNASQYRPEPSAPTLTSADAEWWNRERERLARETRARQIRDEQAFIESSARARRMQEEHRAAEARARLLREERQRSERAQRERTLREEREREQRRVQQEWERRADEQLISLLHLPEICFRHNCRQGCINTSCKRLHICKLFLADICKYGTGCRFGHSLTTVHNNMVCTAYDLDTKQDLVVLQKLRHCLEKKNPFPESLFLNNLEICFKFGTANPCSGDSCNRVHICRSFVSGTCDRGVCKFGHDLHTTHNNGVLSRHRATKMPDQEIIELLRKRLPDWAVKAAKGAGSAASSAKNGAVPRRRPARAADNGGQQPAGLSDELQCPVCLEMFNRATTLGCGHTFCAGCLENVRTQGGDNKCPMCRACITSCTRSVTLDNIISSISRK